MDRSSRLDGGAYSRSAFQAINKTATAASTGDTTEVDCAWVDRMGDGGLALSAKLVITYSAVLGAGPAGGAALKFGVQMQDATAIDGTGSDDYGDAVASTQVDVADSGGSTENGTCEVDIDLSGANRYIRAQITPDLTAPSADTLEWSASLLFYGEGRQPMTSKFGSVGYPT